MNSYHDMSIALHFYLKNVEPVKTARHTAAVQLWEAHRKSPKIARLLFRRMKKAKLDVIRSYIEQAEQAMYEMQVRSRRGTQSPSTYSEEK